MKLDVGSPVVLRIVDEQALLDLVHLPAREKRYGGRSGDSKTQTLTDIDENGFFGVRLWPTLCGLDGWVYAYDGPIRSAVRDAEGRAHVCGVCMAKAATSRFPVETPSRSRRHSSGVLLARPVPAARDRGADAAPNRVAA